MATIELHKKVSVVGEKVVCWHHAPLNRWPCYPFDAECEQADQDGTPVDATCGYCGDVVARISPTTRPLQVPAGMGMRSAVAESCIALDTDDQAAVKRIATEAAQGADDPFNAAYTATMDYLNENF